LSEVCRITTEIAAKIPSLV